MARLRFLLPALLVFAACESNPTAPAESTLSSFSVETALRTMGLAGAPGGTTFEQLRELGKAEFAVRDILDEAESWDEVDAALRTRIESTDSLARWATEQVAALVLLHGYALDGEATDDKFETWERYMPFIEANNTPQIDLAQRGIEMYGDRLTPARQAALSSWATTTGQAYIARKAACGDDCFPSDERSRTLLEDPVVRQTAELRRVAETLTELDAMDIQAQ